MELLDSKKCQTVGGSFSALNEKRLIVQHFELGRVIYMFCRSLHTGMTLFMMFRRSSTRFLEFKTFATCLAISRRCFFGNDSKFHENAIIADSLLKDCV